MTTIALYNHTTKLLGNKEVSFSDLKFMLLDDGASFDATDTSIDDVAGAASPSRANEVHGNGWTEGGEALTSAAWTTVSTNDAKFDADDIEAVATGGPIGPADYGVIYDSDSDKVLAFIDFEGEKEAGETTDFKVVWHSDGIFTFTYT